MGCFGFEAAVMAPVAVSPDTDVSVKSTVPALPQPAAGASGQVDLSAYVSRPLPLGWMSRPSSWACQEPTNGASPGGGGAEDGAGCSNGRRTADCTVGPEGCAGSTVGVW